MTNKLDSGDLILILMSAVRQVIGEVGRLSGDQKDAVVDALIDRIHLDATQYKDQATGKPRYDSDQVRMLIQGLDPRKATVRMRQ